MDIKGPHSFGGYDAKHIAHVQREIARSVKPNLLRQLEDDDLDEAAFLRLLTEDLVDLSPEAKELLRSLRKDRARRKTKKEDPGESNSDFLSLLTGLEDFRKQVEEGQRQDDPAFRRKGQPFMPPSLPLSQHVPRSSSDSSSSWRRPALNEAGELARKMVVYSPKPELKEQLALELQVFGKTIVQQVKQFGVRVIILERQKALTDIRIQGMMMVAPSERTFDGRPWGSVRGIYCSDRRLFVVGEELIGRPNGSVARHEFAHAYDHTFSQKNHRRLPLSVQLWNSFRQERTGLVSAYAATNPAEYFAESVEAFFQEGAREALRQQDPLMFDYLKQLFAA
ncbi:MAG: zinc-dependent peptidase [Vulcanimicrobiota bacterium]